ncbi:uncharacterized protein LOC144926517 [Branchiostoma floridae x Branchiostoma belcheri]
MAAPSASTTWSRNLARVPPLTQQIVDDWANETAKIPRAKQTKGYSNFIEGYIHDVEVQVQAKATDSCKIRARAYPSMKKNDPPYSLTLLSICLQGYNTTLLGWSKTSMGVSIPPSVAHLDI